jgi:PhzF family phenazine biosynthesis protein
MKKFRFKKINAFTAGLSPGNPAAGIYLNNIDDISDYEMQSIARELKGFVNEVVYLFADNNGIFLRYYSSECEVDFCGHGTIAIMFDFIKNNKDLLNKNIIDIKVKNEILKVYNQIIENNSIFITAPNPSYLANNIINDDIPGALNVSLSAIDPLLNVDFINAGLNTLIVPIINLDRCLKINPDQEILKFFCMKNDIDIILIYTREASQNMNHFRTRVFAPKYGYLEDPATGSGNSAFGYYLLKNNLWDGQLLLIEQNNSRELPNIIKLKTIKQNGDTCVIFGGSGIVIIDGHYYLIDKCR